MDYVPHTDAEIAAMLGDLGLSSLDQLWEAIPEALRLAGGDSRRAPGPERARHPGRGRNGWPAPTRL